jgi:predicted TIM-barrel fold metal-dependent hydrolase
MPISKIISAVDHVVEHPDLWTRRLSKSKWGDRIPHLERSKDGATWWIVEGRKTPLADSARAGALLQDRAATLTRWEEIPEAAYVPAERLKAMDRDGIDYAVLYPMLAGFSGEIIAQIKDPDLELACVQAYNDWLVEEWSGVSDRFIAQCIVPLSSIRATVSEITRAVESGHRGIIFPAAPMHLRDLPHINSSQYDSVWAACQGLDMPLCFHAGSAADLFQFPPSPQLAPALAAALQSVTRPASAVFDLANILFSRILLRFPKLKVVFAESTIGWGTFFLEYADHQYEQDHCNYDLKPSEMFHRQCYLTAWYDPAKLNARHIGVGNILWATNFPMANSSWPDSKAFITQCLTGMTDDERRQIVWRNAARLYKVADN